MLLLDTASVSATAPTALPPTDIVLSASSVEENAAQGVLVGTLSTNLGDVSVSWSINNSKFQLSSATGATTELQRSGTGTLTEGVAESVQVTATRLGVPPALQEEFSINVAAPGVPPTNFLYSFSVANWSGSASAGFWRGCLLFADGDMPSTSVPEIRNVGGDVVDAQFDQRSYWPSGDLRLCVCSIRDTSWSGSETRVYNVYETPGSYDNTGTKTVADIAATEDYKVEISSFTQYNGTTTVARGSGAALASFSVDCLTTTRTTKIASGPVREAWMIWGAFYDGADGSGAADPHLKPIWYVDIWKDAADDIADFEYGCVVSQDWWSVANKYRLNYTATLKNASSTIYTYASIQHPYRSQWITVRTDSDNGASKRPWKTSMPTLFYKPDKDYWVSTGLIPPLDTSFLPVANSAVSAINAGPYTASYTPCGNMNHRAFVDGTGAYMGRGMIPNCDAISFMRQTAEDYRYSRNNALAGLSVPYHYRSNNTRSRPGEGIDIANTVISLILDPQAAANYTFTAQGMPAPVNAYAGSAAAAGVKDGYVTPTGGNGVWIPSIDASHAVNYSGFMYLLEGERYLLEATLDLACNCNHQTNGNDFAGRSRAVWYSVTDYRTALSIPATQYGGTGTIRGQTRAAGWQLNLIGWAEALIPDDDVQAGFISAFREQNGNYIAFSMTYMPASEKTAGWWYSNPGTGRYIWSPWMNSFVTQGAYQASNMTGDANLLALADMTAIVPVNQFNQSLNYLSAAYRALATPSAQVWNSATNEYLGAGAQLYTPAPVTIDSTTDVLTRTAGDTWTNYTITNGDVFYPCSATDAGSAAAIPAALSEATPYYAINSTGTTCQLSASVGGAAIDFSGTGSTTYYFCCRLADFNRAVAANPPYLPPADSYSAIAGAALLMAHNRGLAAADQATVDAAEAFLAPVDSSNWVTWKYMETA